MVNKYKKKVVSKCTIKRKVSFFESTKCHNHLKKKKQGL